MWSKQGFLAELCISFVYYVKSTLDQAKSGLSTLGASSPSDLSSLAPGLTLCSLTFSNAEYFTCAHSVLLMQKTLDFHKTGFLQAPSASNQPGRAVRQKQSFRSCSPTRDLKREQHNNQMGGTNQAFENLEGTLVSNSAFKRGKRPRAFTLFIPTHFPIFTWGSNKSGPRWSLQMD